MGSDFYADILDANDVKLGDGPLVNLVSLNDTSSLDQIGGASFAFPAADPRSQYITAGSQFDLYDRVDGNLGRFLYKSKALNESQGEAMLAVDCYDQLRELSRDSVYLRRTYTNADVATVVAALVALFSGWSATVDAGIGNTSVIFQGESGLIAIDALRDRWNKHYRLGAARELQFGAFGASSGVVLTNLRGQVQAEFATATEIAIVDTIRLVEESDEIFNRIVPLGAGQGVAQLTILGATLGSYAVQTGTNADASSFYYIQDATSVAAYGLRTQILTLPQITPITNSAANIVNAANALKLSAEAYIARHLVPKITYDVSVRALRQTVKVGDTVRLRYRGVVDGYSYIDVDADFYVMDITRSRSVGGNRTATLTIATIAARRTADTDVMLNVINDLNALKVHVPISLSKDRVGPYSLRMDSTHTADFTASFGNEVLALNYAKLRFKTSPLKSSVTTVSTASSTAATTTSGGSQTPTSASGDALHYHYVPTQHWTPGGSDYPVYIRAGDAAAGDYFVANMDGFTGAGGNVKTGSDSTTHTHTVTVAAHTHDVTVPAHNHTLSYGIYQDTAYPTSISVAVDGTDRTIVLGGPWAPAGGALASTEVDISNYLAISLQTNHTISFSCASGQGEMEAEVRMLETIQAIAVS